MTDRLLVLGVLILAPGCGPERRSGGVVGPGSQAADDGGRAGAGEHGADDGGDAPGGDADRPPDDGANDGEGEGEIPPPRAGEGEGEGEGEGPLPGQLPEARCVPGTPWQAGTTVYVERTEQWGMAELGVTGPQVNVTDFDGDGWADLLVHGEGGFDQFDDGGERVTWLLRNTGEGRFEDLTLESGFRVRRDGDGDGQGRGRMGQIMASADMDNDGDVDFVTSPWIPDPAQEADRQEVLLGDGAGGFELGPATGDHRREGLESYPFSVTLTDYDRDGFVDIWLVQGGPIPNTKQDELYKGAGDGTFRRATDDVGLTTRAWSSIPDLNNGRAHSWAWAAAACDLNDDGVTELLTASYGRTTNHLWRGADTDDGGVQYTNRSVDSGFAFDGNQDWTDDESAQCWCLENPDDAECDRAQSPPSLQWCEELKAHFGGVYRWDHNFSREPFFTGGVSASTVCADVDNDGHMDLLTGEIKHPDTGQSSDRGELLINTGEPDVRFDRPGLAATGLDRHYVAEGMDEGVMNNAVFDFDNDGWQDVYWSVSGYPFNRAHLYRQARPREFEQLDESDFFEHSQSHGVQAVDLDRDGDLDLVVGHIAVYCDAPFNSTCYDPPLTRVFENVVGARNNWLQVRLQGDGTTTNRTAVGARVEVTTADGVTQTQEVDGGHGRFSTQRDATLHFGLGEHCAADVVVRWPNRALTTESATLPAGWRFDWSQGSAPVASQP